MGRSIESKRQSRNRRKKRQREQRRESRAKQQQFRIDRQLQTAILVARKETASQKQLTLKYSSLWRKITKENKQLTTRLLELKAKEVCL